MYKIETRLSKNILRRIEIAEASTCNNKSLVLNIAIDYSGRWEIVEATKSLVYDCLLGKYNSILGISPLKKLAWGKWDIP